MLCSLALANLLLINTILSTNDKLIWHMALAHHNREVPNHCRTPESNINAKGYSLATESSNQLAHPLTWSGSLPDHSLWYTWDSTTASTTSISTSSSFTTSSSTISTASSTTSWTSSTTHTSTTSIQPSSTVSLIHSK